jgi:hypothetical protein
MILGMGCPRRGDRGTKKHKNPKIYRGKTYLHIYTLCVEVNATRIVADLIGNISRALLVPRCDWVKRITFFPNACVEMFREKSTRYRSTAGQ